MMKILIVIFVSTGFLTIQNSYSQTFSSGLALLDSKWTANGSFRTIVDKPKRFSLSGVVQFDKPYDGGEVKSLIIGSVGYSVLPAVNLLVGTFYSSSIKLNPAISTQYVWSKNKFKGLVYPIWILHDPTVLLTFFRFEYANAINSKLDYFIRFQPYIVSGFWKHHYTRAATRAGIRIRSWEMGFATDTDFVGKELESTNRFGVFFQKKFKRKSKKEILI